MTKEERIALTRQAFDAIEDGDFQFAIDAYTNLIKYEENPEHYYQRSIALIKLGKNEGALADLNYLVELEPDISFRYSCRAFLKDAMGDLQGSVDDYEKALELDPDDAIVNNNLGMVYEKMGRIEEAKKLVKQADLLQRAEFYRKEQRKETPQPKRGGYWGVIRSVFDSRESLKEFINFVKSGFKLKS